MADFLGHTPGNQDTFHRAAALPEETFTSVYFIQEGIEALNRLDLGNDFFHLPLLLLGQGIERLSKLAVVFALFHDEGRIIDSRKMRKKYGHDLLKLRAKLASFLKEHEDALPPALRDDLRFMQEDETLNPLLSILTDFGGDGRYSDLTRLLDGDLKVESPTTAFMQLELAIHASPGEPLTSAVYARMTASIHRYVRAICRLFTLGPFAENSKHLSGALSPFLFMKDEDLSKPTIPPYRR